MSLFRREFLQLLGAAGAAGFSLSGCHGPMGKTGPGAGPSRDPYEVPPFGDVSLLHFTDCHAQLLPVHFREPSVNIGVGQAKGKPPHIVGASLLKHHGIAPGSREAHALTHLNFVEAARTYGKVGGFAHLATLIRRLKDQRPGKTLVLDGGDTWQGSATALWTRGQDMVDACKKLGVDIMTGHWEFTYGAKRVQEIIEKDLKGSIEFVAHNVHHTTWGDAIFAPYSLREIGGVLVAVIGQAFPYTPIANPRYLIDKWSFGIKERGLSKLVEEVRKKGAQIVALLSHNGVDVDLKLAGRLGGIDVILGGHTHDAIPSAIEVENADGKTLVVASGSNGKFLSVLDLSVKNGRMSDYRFKLLPVFSNLLPADAAMQSHIDSVRAPFRDRLEKKLAVTEGLLYRRGNFGGSFDELILDALLEGLDAEIAFSPGFRWGTSLLPGDTITVEDVMAQTAITYGATTLNQLTGQQIKAILEDVADNLYHPDPYYQQGGDMVRVGGLRYSLDLNASAGRRILDLEFKGKPLSAGKTYKVAGWASVRPQPEDRPKIWDVVASYLEQKKTVSLKEPSMPHLKGARGNPGWSSRLR